MIINKKLPMLVDVRDESTDDVRIVLELKSGADPALVMSYLYKHTPLEQSFHVNLTCLVPTENKEIAGPLRLDLAAMLREFLEFRQEVVTRRFQFELAELERRIHILEGFETIFDVLDETIKLIRQSDGKADAAAKMMKRFELDEVQTDAILELKLYKLAKLEILAIREELRDKRGRAKEIRTILGDKRKLWKVIRTELGEVAEKYKDKRRTKIGGAGGEDVEFDAEAFIVDEDVTVILSRDGWLKRVREIKDISATRLREGDAVLAALRGSTKEAIAIFSNQGSCYVTRVNDVPASTGYGEPVQKLFNFRDGERAVGAMLLDAPSAPAGAVALAITRQGYGLRFNLDPHRELSTRAGRRFAKAGRGRRDRGRRGRRSRRRRLRRDHRGASAGVQGRGDPRAGQPRSRGDRHQGRRRRSGGRLWRGPSPRQGMADRRDRRRQEDPDGHRPPVADGARWTRSPARAQDQGRSRDPARSCRHPPRC